MTLAISDVLSSEYSGVRDAMMALDNALGQDESEDGYDDALAAANRLADAADGMLNSVRLRATELEGRDGSA